MLVQPVDRDRMVPNAGLMFNRTVYRMIQAHRREFEIELNENWDCALADLMKRYPTMGHMQLKTQLTRVRNIGAIGIHDDQVRLEQLAFGSPVMFMIRVVAALV